MPYQSQPEKRLTPEALTDTVKRAMQGDQESFRALYEDTYRDKFYIAYKYMKNEQDAADVLQDAYIKAWEGLHCLEAPEKFLPWLTAIVSHTAINALQKKKPLLFSQMPGAEDGADGFTYEEEDFRREYQPEHAYTDAETSELLNEMIGTLSDEQRMCVLMYYIEEQTVKEIAEEAGVSENTVKSRLFYGRQHLKDKADELEKKGYKLYGLLPVPFLAYLLSSEARAMEAQQVAQGAMSQHTAAIMKAAAAAPKAAVAGGAGAAGGVSAATGFGVVKAVAAVAAIALIGGGAYAVSTGALSGGAGGGALPDESTVQQALAPEVRERFDDLLSALGEDEAGQFVWFDDDEYPDLVVSSTARYDTLGAGEYSLYDGETGEPYTLILAGMSRPFVNMEGYIEDGVGGQYYIPHEGILFDEHLTLPDQLMTMVLKKTGPGTLEIDCMISCDKGYTDLSGETPQRVPLPEGERMYLQYSALAEPLGEITREQYEEIRRYGDCEILFGESGYPNEMPDF